MVPLLLLSSRGGVFVETMHGGEGMRRGHFVPVIFLRFSTTAPTTTDGLLSSIERTFPSLSSVSPSSLLALSRALEMGGISDDDAVAAGAAAPARPAKKPAFSARLMQMKFMQRGAERKNLAAAAAAAAKKEEAKEEAPSTSSGPAAAAAAAAAGRAPLRRRFVLLREAEPRPTPDGGDDDDGGGDEGGGGGGVPSTSTAMITGPPALGRLSFNGANNAVDRLLAEAARAAALGGGTSGEGKAVGDEEMVAAPFGRGGGGGGTSSRSPGSRRKTAEHRKPLKRPGILGILQSKIQKPGGGGGSKKKKKKKNTG